MCVCYQSGQWFYLYMMPIQGNFHYKLINRDPSAISILCVCVYFNHNLILASGRYYMYRLLIISRPETNLSSDFQENALRKMNLFFSSSSTSSKASNACRGVD